MTDGSVSFTELQLQRAEYVERMALELARIASGGGLPMLAYLLEMAAEEAAQLRTPGSVSAVPMPALSGRRPRRPPA